MNVAEILSRVKAFANSAHGEQMRKYTPEPYIVHPVRVMELCRKVTDDPTILSAALLHDVLEDTPVKKAEMLEFLYTVMSRQQAIRTMQLVTDLTDVYTKAAYPRYNRSVRKNMERDRIKSTSPDSRTIKYADVIDNCREITQHDPDFAVVFLRECRAMLKVIPGGNQKLYREAMELVNSRLSSFKRS